MVRGAAGISAEPKGRGSGAINFIRAGRPTHLRKPSCYQIGRVDSIPTSAPSLCRLGAASPFSPGSSDEWRHFPKVLNHVGEIGAEANHLGGGQQHMKLPVHEESRPCPQAN